MRLDLRRRRALLITSLGLACAALVAAGGWVAERARLGADAQAAYSRVEQDVRSQFERMSSSLSRVAQARGVPSAAYTVMADGSETSVPINCAARWNKGRRSRSSGGWRRIGSAVAAAAWATRLSDEDIRSNWDRTSCSTLE